MKYAFIDMLRDFERGVLSDASKIPKQSFFSRLFTLITTRPFIDDSGFILRTNRDWYDDFLYIKDLALKNGLRRKKKMLIFINRLDTD